MLFCALFFGALTQAQIQTADVVGTVTDTTGAVLPGATVTITNTATGISQTATTNGTGDYVFNLLQVGTYTVKMEAKGFKTQTVPNIALSAGDRAREDAKMEIGDVTQTVEVSGSSAPMLQTDTSNVGSIVTSQAVQDVPLNGRNFIKLVQLAPGVTIGGQNDTSSGNRPDDRRLTSEYTVNAQGTDINNNMIDGMDNNERFIGTIGVRPSVDAIQEVNVQTNLYDASVSRTGGGVVNVITKSGTNTMHGSLYEFFRNAVLNANPGYSFPSSYCAPGSTTCTPGVLLRTSVAANPAFRQNQFGGSVGGPIKKDKLFYFFDYEGFRQALAVPLTATVPTYCMRGSKMAAMQETYETSIHEAFIAPTGNVCSAAGNSTLQVDPGNFSELTPISLFGGSNSGTKVPIESGPVIPLASQNGLAQALFSLYPLPTALNSTSNNYSSVPARTQRATTSDIKIDYHINNKDSLNGRYSYNQVNTVTPTNFPYVDVKKVDPYWPSSSPDLIVDPGGQGASFPGPATQRQQSIAFDYVHIFRTNLLIDLKAGYLRSATQSLTPNYPNNVTTELTQGALGVSGCTAISCVNYGPPVVSGLADYSTGFTGLGEEGFIPLQTYDNTFNYAGVVTWNKGSHSIRIGAALIRRRLTAFQSSNGVGSFSASGGYTGTAAGDFLEGFGSGLSRSVYLVSPGYRLWEPSTFFQDDWRTNRWLTLNLGIRYDIYTPFTEVRGRISNWDPATGLIEGPSIPGAQQSGSTALVITPYHDISPRIGFAATLGHDMVLRGGYGLTFYPQGYGTPQSLRNAPFNFSASCSVQNEAATATQCVAPNTNGNSAAVNYGACPYTDAKNSAVCQTPLDSTSIPNPSSSVTSSGLPGGVGGLSIVNGTTVPFLSINNVLAPSPCTFDTNADYSIPGIGSNGLVDPATCPNNPYNVGVGNAYYPRSLDGKLSQFNLTLQKQFGANSVSIGYVGELGRHLGVGYSPNHISNNLQNSIDPLTGTFPWLAKSSISLNDTPWGTSSYHSLQATFVRRFQKGLTVQANYTWARALVNSSAPCTPTVSDSTLGFGNGPKYTNPCYYDNPKNTSTPIVVTQLLGGPYGTGTSGLDVPNRISGTVNWELPFGKSTTGILGLLVKGWTANDAFFWQTGAVFGVSSSSAVGTTVGGSRPDQLCNGDNGPKTQESWGIVPTCFQLASVNTYGNAHSNQYFGPSNKDTDFSLFKEFPFPFFKEQVRAQVRAEIFNLFNTPNFSAPSGSIPAFGSGSTLNQAGQLGDIQNPNSPTSLKAGAITSLNNNYNQRLVQFALKFLF